MVKTSSLLFKITKTLFFILFISITTTAYARYCNNPNCRMCNRLFGPMQTYNQYQPSTYQEPVNIYGVDAVEVESTPQIVVDVMLAELNLKTTDILYDLGCGDGRFLISAVKQYGCKAIGIEIDPEVADIARQNVKNARCGRITIVTGDATKFYLNKADAVVMYLFPPLMTKLMKTIRTDRIATYSHKIPNRLCRELNIDNRYPVYILDEFIRTAPLEELVPRK